MKRYLFALIAVLALSLPASASASQATLSPGDILTVNDCYVYPANANMITGTFQAMDKQSTVGPAGWRIDTSLDPTWYGRYGASKTADLFEAADEGVIGRVIVTWTCSPPPPVRHHK